ncbi:MAG: hypothetical protein U9N42_01475 [Campylobacterota bacterium]|nr:hypothetical protein [Campylobacterota bacterium]
MTKLLKYLLFIALFSLLVIGLITYEPITKRVLALYIDVKFKTHSTINEAAFSFEKFSFDIAFENTHLIGSVKYNLDANLSLNSELSLINPLFDLSLPNLPLNIKATISNKILNATTPSLGGNTNFSLNLNSLQYAIDAKELEVQKVLPYFMSESPIESKSVNIDSNGTFKNEFFMPLHVVSSEFTITQDKKQNRYSLETTCNISDSNITTSGVVGAKLFELNDLNTTFVYEPMSLSLNANLVNKKLLPVSIKNVLFRANMLIDTNETTTLHVDANVSDNIYNLELNELLYATKNSKLSLNYILSSTADAPLNLFESRALEGRATFEKGALNAYSNFRDKKDEKIVVNLKNEILHVKSENLSSSSLFQLIKKRNYINSPIKIDATYEIKKESLRASIHSNYSSLIVKNLQKNAKSTTVDGTLHVSRLDRFAKVSKEFKVSSSFRVKLEDKRVHVDVDTKHFNKVYIVSNLIDETLQLNASKVPLKSVFDLVKREPIVVGDVDLVVDVNRSQYDILMKSKKIEVVNQEKNIIPFKLNSALHVESLKDYYMVDGVTKIDSDEITIERLKLNKKSNSIESALHVEVSDVKKSPFKSLQTLNGEFSLSSQLKLQNRLLHVKSELNSSAVTVHSSELKLNLENQDYELVAQFQKESNGSRFFIDSKGVVKDYNSLMSNIKIRQDNKQELEVKARVYTKPTFSGRVSADAFGGTVDLIANKEYLKLFITSISLPKLSQILELKHAITSGELNATVKALTPTLIDSNSSTNTLYYSIDATNININGIDLDSELEIISDTQNISIFKGKIPGISFLKKLEFKEAQSTISPLHFGGVMYDKKLFCDDCAFLTPEHKVAIDGSINVVNREFDGLKIALLGKNNCAYYVQKVSGSLSNPTISYSYTSFALLYGTAKSVLNVATSGVGVGANAIKDVGEVGANVLNRLDLAHYYGDDKNSSSFLSNVVTRATSSPDSIYNTVDDIRKCKPFYSGILKLSNPQQ